MLNYTEVLLYSFFEGGGGVFSHAVSRSLPTIPFFSFISFFSITQFAKGVFPHYRYLIFSGEVQLKHPNNC